MSSRKKYPVHYMTLQVYLKLGLILTHVHRVLSFAQTPFLKPYIDFCTAHRVATPSEFKKRMWKLCINSCFGKFIESVRKYKKCTIVRSDAGLQKSMADPLYESMTILSEKCVLVLSKPTELKMFKPLAVGFTILDRSKDFMYESFYLDIKPKFEHCEVIFSDTDSFCLEIRSQTKIDPLQKIRSLMDFSNYPSSHPLHDKIHQNKLHYFKDECKGDKMTKFVGLRAKCYAFVTEKQDLSVKLKGVTKAYRKNIEFGSYLKCLKTLNTHRIVQYHIRSRKHVITLDKADRLALTSYDANRFLLPCGVHSVPYGSVMSKLDACTRCNENKLLLI